MPSSHSAASFMPQNQSTNTVPYNLQQMMGAVYGSSHVCTAAFSRPAANIHYVQSNQLTSDPAQMDARYGAAQMSLPFNTTVSTQVLDTARNVDRSFGAISSRNQPSHLRDDYICDHSPVTGIASAVYETSGVQGASHLPAHGWSCAAIPASTELRSHHVPNTSWQNLRLQADVELTATAGSVYSVPTPVTSSFPALQTSMQNSVITSIGSPVANSTSAVPSPIISPYSPSAGKAFSDASDSESSRLPIHMQPQYLEYLLQLHCLLLASNKLQSAKYAPSLGAPRCDTYIPGSVTSATRSTMFDVSHLSLLPGSFQHGYTPARFPRSV